MTEPFSYYAHRLSENTLLLADTRAEMGVLRAAYDALVKVLEKVSADERESRCCLIAALGYVPVELKTRVERLLARRPVDL